MKVLILGKNGQLGKALQKYASNKNINFFNSKSDLDISNFDNLEQVISQFDADIIINTAAYTNVEMAEKDNTNLYKSNVLGPYNLALLCKKYKKKLIHISTDYVFDGIKNQPYIEDDQVNPLSEYGKSKLEGENKIINFFDNYLIFRVSWLFSHSKNNFVSKIINISQKKNILEVTNEEYSIPNCADDFAKFIWFASEKFVKSDCRSGVYHFSQNGDIVSRFDFAKKILDIMKNRGHNIPKIIPVSSSNLDYIAKRPKFSALSNKKLIQEFKYSLTNWENSLNNILLKNFIL